MGRNTGEAGTAEGDQQHHPGGPRPKATEGPLLGLEPTTHRRDAPHLYKSRLDMWNKKKRKENVEQEKSQS